jgi:serine protease Do
MTEKGILARRGFGSARAFAAAWALAGIIALVLTSCPGARAQQGPPSIAPIAEKLFDAVVNISSSQTMKGPQGVPLPKVPPGSPFEEFFKDFFDKKSGSEGQRVSSLGSGFVIDSSGLIVTNNHVIADADEIEVTFDDGTELKVDKVVGRDLKTDLALLQVKPARPLATVKIGNSGKMRIGDWVMAIGNPFGYGGSLTVGVISGLKRDIKQGPYDEFMQTDASINKGNSGGPLFNMDGEVIGINTAIISPTGGSIGLGFAIPSNVAVGVIDQLRQFGEMRRGWIGVSIQSVTNEIASGFGMSSAHGALVSQIEPGGPADKAGMQSGDVILNFGGEDVADMRALPKIVALTPVGKDVDVSILRGGKPMTLKVTVARLEEEASKEPPSGDSPDESQPNDQQGNAEPGPQNPPKEESKTVLGMTLEVLTPELRGKYGIADKVEGVLVTNVDPKGEGAKHGVQNVDVIVEISNEKVVSPSDVENRIKGVRDSGHKSALLLLADAKGDIRFVAVPVDASDQ